MNDILVVDDETDIRDLVCDALNDHGYKTRQAKSSSELFDLINKKLPSVVVLDIWLQGSELDGLGILEILKKNFPLMPVIMISGHGNIETAVNSIKMGAYDYLEKPFTEEKLLIMLKRACEALKLLKENEELKQKIVNNNDLIGTSQSILQLRLSIDKTAQATGRVMITGPVGSGKEVVAQLIHKKSRRAGAAFVVLNAAGKSEDELEAEIFGELHQSKFVHTIRKRGLLELAHQGTIFITELTDLPATIQSKLLRFLQDQTIKRGGVLTNINFDIRLITASQHDLLAAITAGKFRQDLYHRLNVMSIKIDPLLERKEDIKPLAEHLLNELAQFAGLAKRKFSEEALATMQSYSWPGNIRQLRNAIDWALIMHGEHPVLKSEMLPAEIYSTAMKLVTSDNDNDMMLLPLRLAREIFEKQYLSAQMNRFNGNISRTAHFVGMERSALHRKLKSLQINTSDVE